MRKVLGVIGVVSSVVVPAFAAPPVAAPFSWTGCYVGATLGGVDGKSDVSWAANRAGFPPPIDPPPINGGGGKYEHGDDHKDRYGDDDHKRGDDDNYRRGDEDGKHRHGDDGKHRHGHDDGKH